MKKTIFAILVMIAVHGAAMACTLRTESYIRVHNQTGREIFLAMAL